MLLPIAAQHFHSTNVAAHSHPGTTLVVIIQTRKRSLPCTTLARHQAMRTLTKDKQANSKFLCIGNLVGQMRFKTKPFHLSSALATCPDCKAAELRVILPRHSLKPNTAPDMSARDDFRQTDLAVRFQLFQRANPVALRHHAAVDFGALEIEAVLQVAERSESVVGTARAQLGNEIASQQIVAQIGERKRRTIQRTSLLHTQPFGDAALAEQVALATLLWIEGARLTDRTHKRRRELVFEEKKKKKKKKKKK
jgi:hypothetical protein